MWSSPDKPINDTFSWRKFHLSVLLKYELEFEPPSEVLESIEYLRPLSVHVEVYREALLRNNPDLLVIAKERLGRVFSRYL
jgi:hypothetical protein